MMGILFCLLWLMVAATVSVAFVRSTAHFSMKNKWAIHGNGKPVEVTFEPLGKVVMAEQGDKLEDVARKCGVTIPFKCRQGRCTSCEVRLNGKVSAKICQGTLIPAGPTKKLSVLVVNKKPL